MLTFKFDLFSVYLLPRVDIVIRYIEVSYQTLSLILVDNGLPFMGFSIVCSFERLLLPEQRSEITES